MVREFGGKGLGKRERRDEVFGGELAVRQSNDVVLGKRDEPDGSPASQKSTDGWRRMKVQRL